jgi:hypothetical protein
VHSLSGSYDSEVSEDENEFRTPSPRSFHSAHPVFLFVHHQGWTSILCTKLNWSQSYKACQNDPDLQNILTFPIQVTKSEHGTFHGIRPSRSSPPAQQINRLGCMHTVNPQSPAIPNFRILHPSQRGTARQSEHSHGRHLGRHSRQLRSTLTSEYGSRKRPAIMKGMMHRAEASGSAQVY